MILYNKTATVYSYTKNQYWVSSYSTDWSQFKCNIQPMESAEWFDSSTVYKMKKLYCEKDWISVGDKIIADSITYIVKYIQKRDGTMRKFYKLIIQESEWN